MGDTASASKILKFQLLVHKEKPQVGHKLLYSTLAKFPQVLRAEQHRPSSALTPLTARLQKNIRN